MSTVSQHVRGTILALGLIACISGPSTSLAQAAAGGTVRGTVVDSVGRAPIQSANVTIAGSRLGALTDNAGTYVIRGVPMGQHVVQMTRIGYVAQTRNVTVIAGSDAVADFTALRSAVQLEQVVTTATGAQRAVELGHVVAMVNTDSLIRSTPVYNVSDMLTSRVAGVMVSAQNGLTGQTAKIRIRGLNSFTVSNDPLVIVDGARVEATSGIASRLGDLSMNEIESVDVVKGPSAATLYGTDAANGVLLIRTKRGRAGRTRWELFGETGAISEDTKDFPVSRYGWGHNPTTGAVTQCLLRTILAGACIQDSVTKFNPLSDAETTPIARGSRGQTGVQASGGSEQLRYFVSGTYEGETGFLRMPSGEQARLKLERGVSTLPDEQLRPNYFGKVNVRGNLTAGLGRNADVTLSNGFIHQNFGNANTEAYRAGYWGSGSKAVNNGYRYEARIGDVFSVRDAQTVMRYLSSLSGNWRPMDWLATRSTLGLDYSSNLKDALQMNGEGPLNTGRVGTRTQAVDGISQYSFDVGATATPTLPMSLSSRTSVGAQYNRRDLTGTSVSGTGLPPGSSTIAGAAAFVARETHQMSVVLGSYVEQQIGWRERLFATAALRADGASSFGKDLHTTVYPKFSLSWLASDEPHFPKIPGVGSVRFRVAYGSSGVQPPSTAAVSTISLAEAVVNGVSLSGATRGETGNTTVRPERQTELEGGFDLEAVGGRVRLELTGYSRESADALVRAPFAASVGGGTRYANLGSVSNKGIEGLVTVRPLDNKHVALDVTLNGSVNHNKLISVGPDAPPGYFYTSGFIGARHQVGYPLYGGWQLPILSYADANGDGILAATEIQVGDVETYIGPTAPTKQATATSSLSLWGDLVRLSALFDWRGGYIRNDYVMWVGCALVGNCEASVVRGSSMKDQAAIMAYTKANSNAGYWSDGAYTKMREASMSLRLPSRALRYSGAQSGNLTLAGRNLFVWSKWSGGDPEVGGATDLEYTFPTPPLPRYFIARVSLSY